MNGTSGPTQNKMLGALKRVGRDAFARFDAWKNEVTGFGTERDKSTYGKVVAQGSLSDPTISALYHGDDMAARMVDIVPDEMLREGFGFETKDDGLDEALNAKFEDLNACAKFADGIRWGRCYGGSVIVIGADDGRDASLPLVPERVRDINYLYVVDRRLLWPASYYTTPGHPKLGQVETYFVTSLNAYQSSMVTVHESRLLIFRGSKTGDIERLALASWDLSILQRPFDVLRSFNTGWRAVETMLTDGNQAIFKMTGLAEAISSGNMNLIQKRAGLTDLYRSVMRAMVIDAESDESFERSAAEFRAIPDVLEKFMLRLAAAAQVPVTILMGQSPAGMNATGESDFRWFYDRIRAQQTTMLAPQIRKLAEIWIRSKAGARKMPKSIGVKFPALWTEAPLQAAQTRKAIADGDAVYITNQAILPDEVAIQRFAPGGFGQELILSPEGVKAREGALSADLGHLGDEPIAPEDATTSTEDVVQTLTLTPSDLAAITTVNEGRASVGLPHLTGPDGALTLPQFKAKYATVIAEAATAEQGGPSPSPAAGRFDATASRMFEMHRKIDETGVSGTGHVADGVEFADGTCVLRWKTSTPGTTVFATREHMMKVHGHDGKTELRCADGSRYDSSEARDVEFMPALYMRARAALRLDFNEDQPRDEQGRFGEGGGAGPSGSKSEALATHSAKRTDAAIAWDESMVERDEQGRFGAGGAQGPSGSKASAVGAGGAPRGSSTQALKAWAHAKAEGVTSEVMKGAASGGFSLRPFAAAPSPSEGVMVSLPTSAGLNTVVEMKSDTKESDVREAVKAWVEKAMVHAAQNAETYLGGFAERDATGKLVAFHFDVSQRFPESQVDRAVQVGRERNQISVWHLSKGQEIKTGGTGRD